MNHAQKYSLVKFATMRPLQHKQPDTSTFNSQKSQQTAPSYTNNKNKTVLDAARSGPEGIFPMLPENMPHDLPGMTFLAPEYYTSDKNDSSKLDEYKKNKAKLSNKDKKYRSLLGLGSFSSKYPSALGFVPYNSKKERIYGKYIDKEMQKAKTYREANYQPTDVLERLKTPVPIEKNRFAAYQRKPNLSRIGLQSLDDSKPVIFSNTDAKNLKTQKSIDDIIQNNERILKLNGFTAGMAKDRLQDLKEGNRINRFKNNLLHEGDHYVYSGPLDSSSYLQDSMLNSIHSNLLNSKTKGYMTGFGGLIGSGAWESDPAMARIQEHMYKTTGSRIESPEEYDKWIQQYDNLNYENADEYPGFNKLPSDVKRFLINRASNKGRQRKRIDKVYRNQIPGYVNNARQNNNSYLNYS